MKKILKERKINIVEKNKKIKGIVISDIHIGAISAKKLRKELVNIFIKKVKEIEDLDLLIINGDFFDHKLSLNSEDSKLGIEILNSLSNLASKNDFYIRIIKGTKNHDNDQLNNFIYLEKKYKGKIRFINLVTDEFLSIKDNNLHLLYLPEEYVEVMSYYDEYLNESKSYDLVFGHGTFSHVGFTNSNQESERPYKNAVTFNYTQFKDIVKGFVMFGHIHEKNEYHNIYYTGSFSRWAFNEEKDKGFYLFDYDCENSNYNLKFIKNDLCDEYKTINIDNIISDENLSSKEKLDIIKKISKSISPNTKLRIVFDNNLLSKYSDSNILKDYFAKEKNFKIKIDNKEKVKEQDEENKILKEYSFLFDENLPIEDIISTYLQKHNNITLSKDVIKGLLYEDND